MGGEPSHQGGQAERTRETGSSQVGVRREAVAGTLIAVNDGDEQQRPCAEAGHDRAAYACVFAGYQEAETDPEHVGTGDVTAGQQQHGPGPCAAAAVGEVPGQQDGEQDGQAFGVEVEGDRPPRPWVESQQHQPGAGQPSRVPQRQVPSRDLAQPQERHELGTHHAGVLKPEQEHAARENPVQQGQRPHDDFGVVLPEREIDHGVVGVQVAVRDQIPGLLILRGVRREREAVVKQSAPEAARRHLQAQDDDADPAYQEQRPVRRGACLDGGVRRRGGGFAHERNLTARMGE